MFFVTEMKKNIMLEPRFFGPHIYATLEASLLKEVEGLCSESHGYIICAYDVKSMDSGKVIAGVGSCVFRMSFKAVVFKPLLSEVLDAQVRIVTESGIVAIAGPTTIFVHHAFLPKDMKFEELGLCPSFVSSDHVKITAGSAVRIRIENVSYQNGKITCTGTMKDDYLGAID